MKTNKHTMTALMAATAMTLTTSIQAGVMTTESKEFIEPVKDKSLCETIFSIPTIYKNKDNPYIQKIAFIGRYQGQYYYLDSNQGDTDDWDNRRARIGMEVDFLQALSFEFNFNLDFDGVTNRFVKSLEDAILTWKVSDEFKLSLGKQKAPITNEWSTSSKKILTIERSRIVNTVAPDVMGGLLASYKGSNGFLAKAGIYTNSVDDDWDYPTFDGSFSLFASVGYAFEGAGTLRLDYLYQDIDANGTNQFTPFEHVFSLNYSAEYGKIGIILDGIYGIGAGSTPDVYGLVVMPTYDITPWLKAVVRYTYGGSEADNGFRLQSRYEREAPDLVTSRGNDYHSIYGGLNWYVCGDKFKFMTGVEYSTMDQAHSSKDFESVTYFGAVRMYF